MRRTRKLHLRRGMVRLRRISPVAEDSGDRPLSEPTAGTQPCRREPLFMPLFGHCLEPVAGLSGVESSRSFPRHWLAEVRHFGSFAADEVVSTKAYSATPRARPGEPLPLSGQRCRSPR
jgi:hypothetical protein